MEITTILFDLDGTLINSEPAAAQAVRDVFSEWGASVSDEDAQFVTGRTWAAALGFLFERYRPPVDRVTATARIMTQYRSALNELLDIVPGSVEAVKALSRGAKLGLVSGSGREEIFWALDRLGVRECFQVVLGAEDYPSSKPAPDGYLKAVELLGAARGRTLVFEDSEAGIASARAAGLWVAAVTAARFGKQDQSRAHWRITDFAGVDPGWVADLVEPILD